MTSSPQPVPADRPGSRDPLAWLEKQAVLPSLLLLVATLGVYARARNNGFVSYDDREYVTHNAQVQGGIDWNTVQWAFTSFDAANWHPLTWLSHALDCQLSGLNPAAHHDTNIALHAINAVLLFLVLRGATGRSGRSLMVAALFALHPIQVESVAWIAERKNLLSMLFFLLALGAYGGYARRPRWDRYLLVALLFALGLMCKPQIVTLPLVLLLWDYWPLQRMFASSAGANSDPAARPFSWLVVEKLPLLALSMVSAAITIKAQRDAGAMTGLSSFPRGVRIENAIVSYVRYLGKAVWPGRLANFYPHPFGLLPLWAVVGSLGLLLLVTAGVLLRRRQRYLPVGWFWFLGTLVPMIGIVQVGAQGMADRYAYLPFVGLFLMAVWGISDWAGRHRLAGLLPVASMLLLLVLAGLTHRQIAYWHDSWTLWSHAAQVTEGNWMAEDNLGDLMLEGQRMEDAMPHFFRAAEINPADPTSNLNVGSYQQRNGDLRGAIEHYQRVLASPLTPPNVRAMAEDNLQRAEDDLGHQGEPSSKQR